MKGLRDQMLQSFIAEARDLVVEMEAGLRQLHAGDRDAELVARIFRAAHSIKGSGGMFGLAPLVGFTHTVESLLDRVRAATLQVDDALASDLIDACDHISDLLELLAVQNGVFEGAVVVRDARLREALARYAAPGAAAEWVVPAPAPAPAPVADEPRVGTDDCWHVSVRFGVDVHRQGINPLTFLRDLEELGEVVRVATVLDAMPPVDLMDPEACYLGFEIDLRANCDKHAIAAVFEFVEDSSIVRILPPSSRIDAFVELIAALPEPNARLGEILVHAGTITREELERALAEQAARAQGPAPAPAHLGQVLVEQRVVAPQVVEAAVEKQAQMRQAPPAASASADTGWVRVRADKLDELINLVGEMVIAGAGASLIAECSGNAPLVEAQSVVARLMEDIRDRALRLRMVPIGETFARFHRVLREVSRDIGKDIELIVEGGDTELDKSVVDRLTDPLMHLVRNSADHGIEPADARTAAGKPARGRITLAACHEAGGILIEIRDDGAGIDRDRILAKGRERGLVPAGHMPGDQEILQLIFEPGFSTAEVVTNLSGRGVGMDVVRRNIHALRGSIEIDSERGAGTTIRIRLPLTLAIIDGFLVSAARSHFVLPLDLIVECVEMPTDLAAHAGYVDLRGQPLPLLRVREQLGLQGERERRENIVVVDCAGQRAGLVVDALLGEFQTVIKPLGPLFAQLRGISGSTILGSGEVALILDVPALVQAAAAHAASPDSLFSERPRGTAAVAVDSTLS